MCFFEWPQFPRRKSIFEQLDDSNFWKWEPASMWQKCPVCETKSNAEKDKCKTCEGKQIINRIDGKPPKK